MLSKSISPMLFNFISRYKQNCNILKDFGWKRRAGFSGKTRKETNMFSEAASPLLTFLPLFSYMSHKHMYGKYIFQQISFKNETVTLLIILNCVSKRIRNVKQYCERIVFWLIQIWYDNAVYCKFSVWYFPGKFNLDWTQFLPFVRKFNLCWYWW